MRDINKHNEQLRERIKDKAFEFDQSIILSQLLNVSGMLDAIMDAQARIIAKTENLEEKEVIEQMIMDANRYAVERFERLADN